jgi:hypothetical protein
MRVDNPGVDGIGPVLWRQGGRNAAVSDDTIPAVIGDFVDVFRPLGLGDPVEDAGRRES